MRILISICLVVFSLPALLGQSAEEEVMRLKQQNQAVLEDGSMENVDETTTFGKETASEKERKGHWNFSVGTSFSYMKGYGSGMSLYAAPTFTLPLSDRWSVHGGLVASQYQGFNGGMTVGMPGVMGGEMFMPSSFTSLAVFASASYRMSDRLILHGTGVKQLMSAPVTPFTPYPMDNLSLGAIYKLGDNVTIGATIHMNNGSYGPGRFGSPMNGSMYPSPFGW